MSEKREGNPAPYYKPGRVYDPELRRLLREKIESGVNVSRIARAIGMTTGHTIKLFIEGKAGLKSATGNRLRMYLESGQEITKGATPIVIERFPVELGIASLGLLKQAGKVEFSLQELYDVMKVALK